MRDWIETVGWLACVVYSTIPAFWLMIHPFAVSWRLRTSSPYRLLVPLWISMWVAVALVTRPVRNMALYQTPWAWVPAAILVVCGAYLYLRSSRSFSNRQLVGLPEIRPQNREQGLVTEGIRARVRHPVYLAHLCEMSAWSVGTGLAVCWGLTVFAIVTGAVMIRLEDAELEKRFGSDHAAYCARVPAIFPKFRVTRSIVALLTAILIVSLALLSGGAHAQSNANSALHQPEVVLVKLSQPNYPPLARQARVMGDVEVRLAIRKDGSVESAVVAGGHPMLQQAALDSAQRSQFECRGCSDEATVYSVVYTFKVGTCVEGVSITESGSHITVTAEEAMASIYFSNISARSVKCLYLWRCGSTWGGTDYYFYRVRSPKCLYLWNCGLHRRPPAVDRCKEDLPIQNP